MDEIWTHEHHVLEYTTTGFWEIVALTLSSSLEPKEEEDETALIETSLLLLEPLTALYVEMEVDLKVQELWKGRE